MAPGYERLKPAKAGFVHTSLGASSAIRSNFNIGLTHIVQGAAMLVVETTDTFDQWFDALDDPDRVNVLASLIVH